MIAVLIAYSLAFVYVVIESVADMRDDMRN
jgi:hypothetical protein